MNLVDALSLSLAMVVLAAMPSTSVFVVVSRAAALGVRHGIATALGIVAGDVAFIAVAILGMTALATWAGGVFEAIQLAGGLYLIWLGLALWRSDPDSGGEQARPAVASCRGSFMAGLLLTLADQKAVLFYLGFFPAFVDLAAISLADTFLVIGIAVLTVGGVKIAYALAADRAGAWLNRRSARKLRKVAAVVMMGIGIVVLCKLAFGLFANALG